jgi:hypothetical protein
MALRGNGSWSGATRPFPGFVGVTEIGHGRVSTVYRARETQSGRKVALKIVDTGGSTEAAQRAFRREMKVIGGLAGHPNLVSLFGMFKTETSDTVLVLELCNESLAAELRSSGRFTPAQVVSIGAKIAGALAAAHGAGVVHGDVKPESVLRTEWGEPSLGDFGMARLCPTDPSAAPTEAGFTAVHAAPELLDGKTATSASDVYSLASTMYELVSGTPAFRQAPGELPFSTIVRIMSEPPPALTTGGVSAALSAVLLAAMSKQPDDRPDAFDFAEALQGVEASEGREVTPFALLDATGRARMLANPVIVHSAAPAAAAPAIAAAVAAPPVTAPAVPQPENGDALPGIDALIGAVELTALSGTGWAAAATEVGAAKPPNSAKPLEHRRGLRQLRQHLR